MSIEYSIEVLTSVLCFQDRTYMGSFTTIDIKKRITINVLVHDTVNLKLAYWEVKTFF